jgi:hypothetical protein
MHNYNLTQALCRVGVYYFLYATTPSLTSVVRIGTYLYSGVQLGARLGDCSPSVKYWTWLL